MPGNSGKTKNQQAAGHAWQQQAAAAGRISRPQQPCSGGGAQPSPPRPMSPAAQAVLGKKNDCSVLTADRKPETSTITDSSCHTLTLLGATGLLFCLLLTAPTGNEAASRTAPAKGSSAAACGTTEARWNPPSAPTCTHPPEPAVAGLPVRRMRPCRRDA
jgi:hypothetical protein